MTSGAWGGNPDSTIFDSQQRLKLATGTIGLKDILLSEQVSRAHRNNVFSAKRKPGEVFAYRSTDPLVLARILEIVTSETYGQFIEANILKPAGISNPAISGRDFFEFPRADGVLRLTLEDWIRVAIWIQEQRKRTDCLGGFLLTATQRQVDNSTGSNFPQAFKSYGYYFGINNENVQDSFWAVGFGGQRIGWSIHGEKIIITFSNSDAHIKNLERLFNQWITQKN
jgi:CubicO group peptidase (beta-lactamase class C family)